MNAQEAAPFVGKVVEGAVLGAYTFDKYRQEKDEFLAKEAELTVFAHPDHESDAEARKSRYMWVSDCVNGARTIIATSYSHTPRMMEFDRRTHCHASACRHRLVELWR